MSEFNNVEASVLALNSKHPTRKTPVPKVPPYENAVSLHTEGTTSGTCARRIGLVFRMEDGDVRRIDLVGGT